MVIVVASTAMVVGSSKAVFSASSNITNNITTSGTVNILAHSFTGNKPIGTIATYLAPGQSTPDGRAELYNTGNLPVRLYMYLDGVSGSACNKTWLTVQTGYAGGNETQRTVTSQLIPNLSGSTNRVEVTGNPPFTTLGPNISQVVHQYATLDSTADNSYMGEGCSWTEVFVAESVTP